MGTYSDAIWIAAPPDSVYDLYTDLDRVGEWQEGKPYEAGVARRAIAAPALPVNDHV